ncbi:hypothetical protein [Floridanema aerugineum]|uniref:Uncharacterized protein n=1 Tax=Floridaenema aerugineum BLCC-F46 TaxID=3153654 RepID=A0ABV4X587_9CYAN
MQFDFSRFKKLFLQTTIASSAIAFGAVLTVSSLGNAQNLTPLALSEIRTEFKKAPYSKIFTIGPAYLIKDRDYKAGASEVGVFDTWINIPNQNRLQLNVNYCVNKEDIANTGAYLTDVVLLDANNKPIVVINQFIKTSVSQTTQVIPGQYIPGAYYTDPFYDPFGYDWGFGAPIYFPPVDCSMGFARFDLMPVAKQLANLPNQTIKAKLIFNNGLSYNWAIGSGTVSQIKLLPTVNKNSSI